MLTIEFRRFPLDEGMVALDAGCGQGRHSLELLRRRCPVIALDLNGDDLSHTRFLLTALAKDGAVAEGPAQTQRTGRRSGFLTLRGNTLALPFRAARFDRIICSEVLEHVTDPAQAVSELGRVLKPGGLLAVSVPTPFTERAYRFASDDYFNTPGGHVRIFSPHSLTALLTAEHLRVLDLTFAHAFHSVYWWLRCVFGLHAERHPVILLMKKVLTYRMFSPQLGRAEEVLDFVIPKSMVIYARKEAAPPWKRNGA